MNADPDMSRLVNADLPRERAAALHSEPHGISDGLITSAIIYKISYLTSVENDQKVIRLSNTRGDTLYIYSTGSI